jgi:Tol biopolymer transport system component
MRTLFPTLLVALVAAAAPVKAGTHAAPQMPAGSILFSGGPGVSLYAVDAHGDRLRLLAPRRFVVVSSAWSPDGKLLAYTRREGACCPVRTVVTIADRRGRSSDVAVLKGYSDVDVGSWSPDSSRVAVSGAVNTTSAIFVIDVRNGRLSQVTQPVDAYDDKPQWSPNGSAIMFRRSSPSNVPKMRDVWLVDPQGRHPCRVTSGADVFDASWAPDSRRAVVGEGGLYGKPGGKIGVLNVATRRKTTLVSRAKGSYAAAWSPNGRWIALSGTPDTSTQKGGTYLVGPGGRRFHRVSARGNSFTRISWSPDSRAIAVADSACHTDSCSGYPDIWIVPADGSAARRLTDGSTYGDRNWDPQWHPASLPAARLGGQWVPWSRPTDSVVGGTTVVAAEVIDSVSADGARAVVKVASSCFLRRWNAFDGSLVQLFEACDAPGRDGIAVAGDWFAWTTLGSAPGADVWEVVGGSFQNPTRTTLFGTCKVDQCDPIDGLLGDGPLLVVGTWGPCRLSQQNEPCVSKPKFGGELWRLDGQNPVRIATAPGALTPVAAGGDRILADREDGTFALYDANGTLQHSLSLGRPLGTALDASDLVVLRAGALDDFDVATGALRHSWPITAANPTLAGVQNGIAAIVSGSDVDLLHVADGSISVVNGGPDLHADLTPAGLFYSYTAEDWNYPGRVVFLPFDELKA